MPTDLTGAQRNEAIYLSDSAGNLVTVTGNKLDVNAAAAAAVDTTASGAVGALNAFLAVAMAGQQSAAFVLPAANNLIGTLTFQCSVDGGTTYVTTGLQYRTVSSALGVWTAASTTIAASSTVEAYQVAAPGGASHVRVIATAYTSGSATVTARSTASDGLQVVQGTVAAGAAISGNPVLVAGSDGTNARSLSTDTTGALKTIPSISTAGGSTIYHVVAAASTNAANVKASAGQVYGWDIFNDAGYPIYVKFYNTAGTPTAGTGVVYTIGVQSGLPSAVSIPEGMPFATGIGISITKGITDADTTAVLLSDCVVNIRYK